MCTSTGSCLNDSLSLVHEVQSIKDEDELDIMLFEDLQVMFNHALKSVGSTAERIDEGLVFLAIETEVKVVGRVDTNDSVLQG